MAFCNWYTVNKELFKNGLSQTSCMDISSENLVKMDNKRINLIQHTLIGECSSKDGSKQPKEMGPNDAYNILWKSFQFDKGLEVLQKVYNKLRNESNSDKKVNFLKIRDKLMKEKPLKVMGLPVSYSDTSLSISIENELPTFKKALLSDTLPTEFKSKPEKTKKTIKVKRKEVVEKKVEKEEEPKDLDAHVVQPGRTTSSKKDYKKSKKKNMAELKDMFRDPPKKIPKEKKEEEKEASIEEEIYPEPEEQPVAVEETIEEAAPEEDMEDKNEKVVKPPKPKKRTIKKIKEKKKDPPKPEPPPEPTFKLRKILPTDKRRASESDALQKLDSLQRRKRRWSNDDRGTYKGKIDLSPLRVKMPPRSSGETELNKIKLKKVDKEKELEVLRLREIELREKKKAGGAKVLAAKGRSVRHMVEAIQDQNFEDDEPVNRTVTKIEKASVKEFTIPKE